MKLSVLMALLFATASRVSGERFSYNVPHEPHLQHNFIDSHTFDIHQQFGSLCSEGEAINAEGRCVPAKITRNFFVFKAPPTPNFPIGPPLRLPDPKIHYNFVFIRSPETVGNVKPIVVPPPQQKTLVYVLSKRPGIADQEVIEVPSQPVQPEVFFVNYAPGDDAELPGGVSLQDALGQSAIQGETIDSSSHGKFGSNDLLHGGSGNTLGQNDHQIGGSVNTLKQFGLNHQVHGGFENTHQTLGSNSLSGSYGAGDDSQKQTNFIHEPTRPRPRLVPPRKRPGHEKTSFEDIRAPDPIDILPPAPFYPKV